MTNKQLQERQNEQERERQRELERKNQNKKEISEYELEHKKIATAQKPKRKKRDTTYNPMTLAKDYFTGNDEKEME